MFVGWIGFRVAAMAPLVVLAIGCASTGKVQKQLAEKMRLADYRGAIQVVEDQKTEGFDGKNRLLYFLELGMLLHFDGQYRKSNEAFEAAKWVGDALYTKSLSSEGFSWLSNDYALDYAGENFERTLIHVFSTLNYVLLRDLDSALVEVRQVGEYLRKLQVDSSNENTYQEDAFARYLSALIYEAAGEFDSAFVDYKKAVAAYRGYRSNYAVARPGSLMSNAERVASRLGTWAQLDLLDLGGQLSPRFLPAGAGEVVVLHYNGLAPIKGQDKYTIPFSEAWLLVGALQAVASHDDRVQINRAIAISSQVSGVDVVSVAFPKFIDRPYAIATMRPKVTDAIEISPPELVEDIGAIAKKDLADRIVRIRARTIARAAIKFALQKEAEFVAARAGGDQGPLIAAVIQIAGNIARFASEQADKRGWSTLPDQIWMSSLVLSEGTHDISVDFLNTRQAVVESRAIPSVRVSPGSRQFIIVRTVK
jgi:hypothetical protein